MIFARLLLLCKIMKNIEAIYQMNITFKPPIIMKQQIIENCTQYVDSNIYDDFLTNCLFVDGLPKWKPLSLSEEWNEDSFKLGNSTHIINYRISCCRNFFGKNCSKYCKPASDKLSGFYSCSEDGDKICISGYSGKDCKVKNIEEEPQYNSFMFIPLNERILSLKRNFFTDISAGLIFFLVISSVYMIIAYWLPVVQLFARIYGISFKKRVDILRMPCKRQEDKSFELVLLEEGRLHKPSAGYVSASWVKY